MKDEEETPLAFSSFILHPSSFVALRISNLRLKLDEPESALPAHIARSLGLPADSVHQWRILRKSFDTRDKDALRFVYTVEVTLPEGDARIAHLAGARGRSGLRIEPYREPPFSMPAPGTRPLGHRPVVVGSGPAGLVAAYFLAEPAY